jgi:hypothetical protein
LSGGNCQYTCSTGYTWNGAACVSAAASAVITITLNYPNDNVWNTTTRTITHYYTPVITGTSANYLNCTLYTNYTGTWGSIVGNATPIPNNTVNSIQYAYAADNANVKWNIYCWNASGSPSNYSSTNKTIKIDITSPTTTATAVKNDSVTYTFGTWTNSTYVNVTLSCSDGSGSGCQGQMPKYCNDTSNSCTPSTAYSNPVQITTEGTSYIRYNSTDAVGKSEAVKSQTININTTPPSQVTNLINNVTLNSPQTNLTLDVGQNFVMNCTPSTDDSAYGINMSFEFNYTGNPNFVEVPLSGSMLTANASGEQNVRNSTSYSRVITVNGGGYYYVRCRAYNATHSVYSATQKVTAAEVHTDKKNYKSCGEVRYKVSVYGSDNTPMDQNLTINIYDPSGNIVNQSKVHTLSGVYTGVYMLQAGSQIGEWFIRAFSCGIFNKTFGVGGGNRQEFWRMDWVMLNRVKYSPSEPISFTLRFLNQAGEGTGVIGPTVTIDGSVVPCSQLRIGESRCSTNAPSSTGVHVLNVVAVYAPTGRIINETRYLYVGG